MTSATETGKPAGGNGPLAGLRDYLNAPTAASARQASARGSLAPPMSDHNAASSR